MFPSSGSRTGLDVRAKLHLGGLQLAVVRLQLSVVVVEFSTWMPGEDVMVTLDTALAMLVCHTHIVAHP